MSRNEEEEMREFEVVVRSDGKEIGKVKVANEMWSREGAVREFLGWLEMMMMSEREKEDQNEQ